MSRRPAPPVCDEASLPLRALQSVNMQQREWNHRTGHRATLKKVRPLTRRVDAAAEIKVEARENREKRWQPTVESRRFSCNAASGIRSTVPFLPRARD